jgi:hypothetical protein
MRSKTDYRDYYGRLKDFAIAVSRETGVLRYMLARSCRARLSSSSGLHSASRRSTSPQLCATTAAD